MSCEEFDSMTPSEMSLLPLTCLHHISSFPITKIAYALPPPTLGPFVFHSENLSDYEESLQGVAFPPFVSRNSHHHHNRYSGRFSYSSPFPFALHFLLSRHLLSLAVLEETGSLL